MAPAADPNPALRSDAEGVDLRTVALRGSLGGVLMGLANLVPGISGGTMLLAAGVYPAFVSAIAELTTLRFRARSVILLATVVLSAALAILLLAGPTKTLVVERRWVMYSLFIGLTLGGIPLVWRLARPASTSTWAGAAAGFGLMVWMALAPGGGGSSGSSLLLLMLAGMAGASAMILPGVSGGYLLLLLGQYVPILAGIDALKQGLLGGGGPDPELLLQGLRVAVPVGVGVVLGVVGVSNLLRFALERFPKATLGLLLGLLAGAVAGLWPFQEGAPPRVGESFKGLPVTEERLATIEPEDWPLRRFSPGGSQVAGALALIGAGLAGTLAIDRVGRAGERKDAGRNAH